MDEVEEQFQLHRKLRGSMPFAWGSFFSRFGTLRPVQIAAIPPILAGRSTLVTAPTAGGKTEAIAAPVCDRLASLRWPGLSVLLITPTRALVNDLFMRLEKPLAETQIGLGRKTSDHPAWDDPRLQFLVTTPESTESLLTFHREVLDNLQAVIIDEVHLLDGTARGDQLRVVLQRLIKYLAHRRQGGFLGLQRIAMSATVADPRRLADSFLGQGAEVVTVPGQRAIEAKIITARGEEEERISAAVQAMEKFPDVRKVLVFVNSRKQVDTAGAHFAQGRFRHFRILGHHGSLSKESREFVEGRFKEEQHAICVATMTLEVGIDIGDIDLVVCLDPPYSLSSFLQRIGRGCRRLQGKTRVLCIARDACSELIFRGLIHQASLGVPAGPNLPFRRSVLVQQTLAYLQQVPKNRRTEKQFCEAFANVHDTVLCKQTVSQVLSDLVSNGLLHLQNGIYQPASAGWGFIKSGRVYSNMSPSPKETAVVDADSGKVIASIAAVDLSSGGVRIAGKSYEVLRASNADHVLVREGGDFGTGPSYHTSSLPYAFDIGACVRNLLQIDATQIVCLRHRDGVAVFTWLGKLLNAALCEALSPLGVQAKAEGLYIFGIGIDVASITGSIRLAIDGMADRNPMRSLAVENFADMGPHFLHLSEGVQAQCREDWLDLDYLRRWSHALAPIREVESDSELARQLASLIR